MSHTGKLARGMKWWKHHRDLDGNLKEYITNDLPKMEDVNYYLKFTEGKDKEKVDLALYKLHLLRKAAGGVRSQLFQDLKEELSGSSSSMSETPEEE